MRARLAAFTLIELMIVVSILGILAAVAIPSFVAYTRRAKSAEATLMLNALYARAATYYERDRFAGGIDGTHIRGCAVSSADNKLTPGANKRPGDYTDPGFLALDFRQEATYFHYAIDDVFAAAGGCSVPASTAVYALRARGDLDADTHTSVFELAVGTNADSALYHGHSFFVADELE